MNENQQGPLESIRVLDVTQMLSGPFATMILADLGAEVIKIEPPEGDMTREQEPHLTEDDAYGGYFHSVNRNKRSVVIDLKTGDGKDVFRKLVDDADVVIENFRSGTMKKLGLPYEELKEINPELIYASIRGFGDPRTGESPYAGRPAFDIIAQAMGGMMSITGTDSPTKAGPGVGDIFPAVLSVVGILSAIFHRDRTGEGQYVDVSMIDGILSLCERIVYQYSFDDEVPDPQGSTHPLLFPFDRFEASDGYIIIAAPATDQWKELCEYMDRPELGEKYDDDVERVNNANELRPIVNEWTRRHTKEELFDMLGNDVPCGPVNNVRDIFSDPHFEARDMLENIEHADTGKEVTLAGTPIKFSRTPGGVRKRGPFLGEDSEDVLREAGFNQEEIADLLNSDVILTESPE